MALLDSWLNSDTFNLLRDKVNAIVAALNPARVGVVGNVLRKNSATDFDASYTNEFAYNCVAFSSTSFPVNGAGANYVLRGFGVPAGMQYTEGARVRATAIIAGVVQSGVYLDGVVYAYVGTDLAITIDTIKGTGSYTDWLITASNGGDAEVIVQTSTPVAGNNAIVGTGTYTSQNYSYTYRKRGNFLHLSFVAIIVMNVGAVTGKIKIPLPTGITKDITGGQAFSMFGSGWYNAPGSTTDICPLFVSAIDDGTEGQRLVLERTDGASMTVSNGVTVYLKGSITMPIL